MFDHENVSGVDPTATRAEQLANIRLIYPAVSTTISRNSQIATSPVSQVIDPT
jgi:hypothetical protein